MSQVTDYIIDNQTFPATRADLNDVLDAIKTSNSGTSAPSSPPIGQVWADTTNNLLKVRNGAGTAWNAFARMNTILTTTITSNTTINETYNKAIIPVNASSGNITITLPAATIAANLEFLFIREDTSTNTVSIVPSGSDAINSLTALPLNTVYGSLHLVSVAAAWYGQYSHDTGVGKRTTWSSIGQRDVYTTNTGTGTPIEHNVLGTLIQPALIDINVQTGGTAAIRVRRNSNGVCIGFINSAITQVGSIAIDGVGTTTAYNTSSDHRMKNPTNAPSGYNPVQTFQEVLDAMRWYTWKGHGTTKELGWYAHELAEVYPKAVTGEKDAIDESGNPIYQGRDDSKLIPLLVQTIGALLARIEALEAAQ